MKSGFSLVELSIVLVILGLLTGGILSGQSLIRASELRAVTTEFERYLTATRAFRDKYNALPGDMANATSFWGFAGTAASPGCVSNAGIATISTPGTCDGNGDGKMMAPGAPGQTGEIYRYWQQMTLAGMLEGNYTGNAGPGHVLNMIPGTNIPKSRLTNGSWAIREYYPGVTAADANMFAGTYGNWFQFGAPLGVTDNYTPVLKAEELWNIDTKIDDGRPTSGKVYARRSSNVNCTTAPTDGDAAAVYNLSNSGITCVMLMLQAIN